MKDVFLKRKVRYTLRLYGTLMSQREP